MLKEKQRIEKISKKLLQFSPNHLLTSEFSLAAACRQDEMCRAYQSRHVLKVVLIWIFPKSLYWRSEKRQVRISFRFVLSIRGSN